MAVTVIKKAAPNGELLNMMFKSEYVHIDGENEGDEMQELLVVNVAIVNEKLEVIGQPSPYKVDQLDERGFHTELRARAAKENDLITSHSTDPDWNPEGYSKNMDDE